jgi:uncharacterized protein (DUF2147 family)
LHSPDVVCIEPCGQNLCGYAVGSGEKILINMKPEDKHWVGRIHDPDSGKDYDSTIAMRGANTLKVQGCAFGGLFGGGQTGSASAENQSLKRDEIRLNRHRALAL